MLHSLISPETSKHYGAKKKTAKEEINTIKADIDAEKSIIDIVATAKENGSDIIQSLQDRVKIEVIQI